MRLTSCHLCNHKLSTKNIPNTKVLTTDFCGTGTAGYAQFKKKKKKNWILFFWIENQVHLHG